MDLVASSVGVAEGPARRGSEGATWAVSGNGSAGLSILPLGLRGIRLSGTNTRGIVSLGHVVEDMKTCKLEHYNLEALSLGIP